MPRISAAHLGAAFALYVVAYAVRGARLDLLLPRAERIGLFRASALSGASAFLLQVIPFRGGDVASWALYRRELRVSWSRSGAVFALVKAVDSAAMLITGLAGGALLAVRRGTPAAGETVLTLVAAAALALLLLPVAGSALLARVARGFPDGSRRRRVAEELAGGLAQARLRPALYALACALALLFLAAHTVSILLVMRGLGLPVSLAALAFASLASTFAALVIPSPAGTFGSAESGFAGALALDGLPVARGLASGVVVHLVITLASALVGLPLFLAARRREDPAGADPGDKMLP